MVGHWQCEWPLSPLVSQVKAKVYKEGTGEAPHLESTPKKHVLHSPSYFQGEAGNIEVASCPGMARVNAGPSKGSGGLALWQTHSPSCSRNVKFPDRSLTRKGVLIPPFLLPCSVTPESSRERKRGSKEGKEEKSIWKIKGGQFPLIKPVIGLRIKLNHRASHSQSAILSLIRLY